MKTMYQISWSLIFVSIIHSPLMSVPLTVKLPDLNRIVVIETSPSDTMRTVKMNALAKAGLLPDSVHDYQLHRQELSDEKTVADYKLSGQEELHLTGEKNTHMHACCKISKGAQYVSDFAGKVADKAHKTAQAAVHKVKDAAHTVAQKTNEAVEKTHLAARDAANKTEHAFKEGVHSVTKTGKHVSHRFNEAIAQGAKAVSETALHVAQKADEVAMNAILDEEREEEAVVAERKARS